MDPLILANVFPSDHIGNKYCFCGKPAVEDHEFYFCSPGCARADSLRTLGGQGDSHYRNVMQRARANPPAAQHTLARVAELDLESEDKENLAPLPRKRAVSEVCDEEQEPVKKKPKKDAVLEDEEQHKKALPKKKVVKKESAAKVVVCNDDEDLYFARLAMSNDTSSMSHVSLPTSDTVLAFRKHITGSARTEGYYKISHAEKSAYVAQYALRSTNVESVAPTEAPAQPITSSRSNRANARRRAKGLEEINQVQRAVALSKGETAAAELSIKFNQLQTRKKHLRFARSPIHDWGLYAMERIARGEMVIEYVGEIIRAQVADKREKAYERQGIGSSYLFRIDEDLVVDATKKGNLG
jgi:hypothetical protein